MAPGPVVYRWGSAIGLTSTARLIIVLTRKSCAPASQGNVLENHPRHRAVGLGNIHLSSVDGTWMENRNSGRDLCHGRRSLLQLRETQDSTWPQAAWPLASITFRSFSSLSLPAAAAAVEHSRHCGRGDDLRRGRTDSIAHSFQVESSRRAPLTAIRECLLWGHQRASLRRVRMPCLAPWRCREVSPSQHHLLEHHQSQEKTPPRQLLRPSG